MTTERLDHDQVAQRLTQALGAEANAIEVSDAWDAIAGRLIERGQFGPRPRPVTALRLRRMLGGVAVGLGTAALVLAVVLGWRPAALTPAPIAPAATVVPRFDASIPTLVVYRTTAGAYLRPHGTPVPRSFTITPERMRTDSRNIGQAALEAMFETAPVQPGNLDWAEQLAAQKVEVTSVTVSGGLIRVKLNGIYTPVFTEPEAHVMAQTWVRTLQDTLGVRDDVLITLQGKSFWLYGAIDTAKPLTRDESISVVRSDGLDSPRHGDVVPSTFVLLGSTTTVPEQPARMQIVDLDTGATAYEQEVVGPADRAAAVDFEPVLTLEPGRYRATVSGRGGVAGVDDITFTVVT